MSSQVHISAHPLVQHKMTLLRDQRTEPKKFRELMREIAVLVACEATADLAIEEVTVVTPLGQADGYRLKERVGLVPILRDEQTLKPVEYYSRLPVSPTVDVCLVLDPMLATGGSAVTAVDILKRWGASRIKFVGIIASADGVRRLTATHPDVPLYLAAVDEQLNEAGLIVPGLGNAGDRQFGTG
jgi:uracil phosphoribosyltransferase